MTSKTPASRNTSLLLVLLLWSGAPGHAADFTVTATAAESDYTINGTPGSPTLTLVRGATYTFEIDACSCHPFQILGAPAGAVMNNDIFSGTITFIVPENAANYTYICSLHGFGGSITTIEPPEPAFPPLRLELVVEKQLQSPTAITHAGDGSGRLFVGEQRGVIRVVKNGVLQPTPFLDVSSKLTPEQPGFDERGLLGLAFHPRFGQTGQPGAGRLYVFYSAPSPNAPGSTDAPVNCQSVIAEYTVSATDPEQADPASERRLLSFDKPQFNHNGGQLAFGPDGLLYIGTGDGGGGDDNNAGHTGGTAAAPRPTNALGNSQDRSNLLGKILRIDPLGTSAPGGQYAIPADNPFVGEEGVREEIWAYGLRNPWRFSFDRVTGRLFCADVGQGEIEEIDLIVKGGNYGWRNLEGTFTPNFSIDAPPLVAPPIAPLAQYAHPGVIKGEPPLPVLGVSITGGFLYRGPALPELQGKYVFGDYSQDGTGPTGVVLGLHEAAPDAWEISMLDLVGGNPIGGFLQTFGEDEAGEIYLGSKTTRAVSQPDGGQPAGSLHRLAPLAETPLTHRQEWERRYYFLGQFIDPQGDDDGDGVENLLEYAWNAHPRQKQPPEEGFRLTSGAAGSFTVAFRRDPRATDLTYRLEGSATLATWEPLVTSLGGNAPTGSALVGETDVTAQEPLKEVTAAVPLAGHRFLRLTVERL